MSNADSIRTERAAHCPLCKGQGEVVHTDLKDYWFGVPGEWEMSRCEACELVWLSKRPELSELGKVYQNYYTHGGQNAGVDYRRFVGDQGWKASLRETYIDLLTQVREAVRHRWLGHRWGSTGGCAWLLSYPLSLLSNVRDIALLEFAQMPAQPAQRFLDVGCGDGQLLARVASLGHECEGVEPDPEAAKLAAAYEGVCVKTGFLHDQHYPDAHFAALHSSHVLEHVYDPKDFVAECLRVLKPGGRLVFSTPNIGGLGYRTFGAQWRGLEPPRHITVFSVESIERLFREAGFERVKVRTTGRLTRGIWHASLIALREKQAQPFSRVDYFKSFIASLCVDVRLLFQPRCGDELVVEAYKP